MIMSRNQLKKVIDFMREADHKTTFGITNGVFDILHAGHVDFIREAQMRCDFLIVSLNTDDSVKKNKGNSRPIMSLEERLMVVVALKDVDYVTWHDETNMNKTMEILKPDFYIKGGDYSADNMSSTPIVRSYGGEVILVPFHYDISTTKIIKRIKGQ